MLLKDYLLNVSILKQRNRKMFAVITMIQIAMDIEIKRKKERNAKTYKNKNRKRRKLLVICRGHNRTYRV